MQIDNDEIIFERYVDSLVQDEDKTENWSKQNTGKCRQITASDPTSLQVLFWYQWKLLWNSMIQMTQINKDHSCVIILCIFLHGRTLLLHQQRDNKSHYGQVQCSMFFKAHALLWPWTPADVAHASMCDKSVGNHLMYACTQSINIYQLCTPSGKI